MKEWFFGFCDKVKSFASQKHKTHSLRVLGDDLNKFFTLIAIDQWLAYIGVYYMLERQIECKFSIFVVFHH